jgi:hypothetical protein
MLSAMSAIARRIAHRTRGRANRNLSAFPRLSSAAVPSAAVPVESDFAGSDFAGSDSYPLTLPLVLQQQFVIDCLSSLVVAGFSAVLVASSPG